MSKPRGMGIYNCCQSGCGPCIRYTVTRRFRTGILVYLNCFTGSIGGARSRPALSHHLLGAEFIAMKQCCEYLHGLRYKLCMMGIPCNQPSHIYSDNQSVLANTTMPDSTVKKKSQSIAYHFVHDGSSHGDW